MESEWNEEGSIKRLLIGTLDSRKIDGLQTQRLIRVDPTLYLEKLDTTWRLSETRAVGPMGKKRRS